MNEDINQPLLNENSKFIEHYYHFNIYRKGMLEAIPIEEKNSNATRAEKHLQSLLIIVLSGCANEDYRNWLMWNWPYPVRHWIEEVAVKHGEHDVNDNMMELINRITNELSAIKCSALPLVHEDFITDLNDFRHKKLVLINKRNRSLAESTCAHLSSICRKIILLRNKRLYEDHKNSLARDYAEITRTLVEYNFADLLNAIEHDWKLYTEDAEKLFATEEVLYQNQLDRISVTLEKYNLEQEKGLIQQILDKIGEMYERIKVELDRIVEGTFKLSHLITNPILHPIDTAKNVWYAIKHPRHTFKTVWQWIKEHPGQTALMVLGCVGGAVIIGLTFGVAVPVIASSGIAAIATVSLLDLTIAGAIAGGIGSLALVGCVSLAGAEAHNKVAERAKAEVGRELQERSLFVSDELQKLKCAREAVNRFEEEKRKTVNQSSGDNSKSLIVPASNANTDVSGNQHVESVIGDAYQKLEAYRNDAVSQLVEVSREVRSLAERNEVLRASNLRVSNEAAKIIQNYHKFSFFAHASIRLLPQTINASASALKILAQKQIEHLIHNGLYIEAGNIIKEMKNAEDKADWSPLYKFLQPTLDKKLAKRA